MKNLIQNLLCAGLYCIIFPMTAQTSQLDVEGHTRIQGNIDINHMDDSTSVFIGRNAGVNTSFDSRRNNTFVGSSAGYHNTSGGDNSFFGTRAGRDNIDGDQNSFFGFQAGINNSTGQHNSFFGSTSGSVTEDGSGNSFFGTGSGCENLSGDFNSFFGSSAGESNTVGTQNSFFGESAGSRNSTGTRNTYLGTQADQVGDSLDRAIAVGYRAQVDCSHCAVIGGTGVDAVNVGINTTTPTERLDINGNARIRAVSTGAFKYPLSLANNGVLTTDASDRRLKENIAGISQPLKKTLALNGVSYNWISDVTKEPRIGLLAQEVENVLPEVVFTNEVDGYKGVRYQEIVALLIESIKEQQVSLLQLSQENTLLKTRISKIEAQIKNLSNMQTQNR